MQAQISETYYLSAGEANAEKVMSLPLLIAKFIDLATVHANSLEIGNPHMSEINGGWVLARLAVEMNRYPATNTHYTITTWMQSFNKHFSVRCFKVEDERNETIGYARSVWMVMDTVNHISLGLSHFTVNPNLVSGIDVPIAPQAKHLASYDKNKATDIREKPYFSVNEHVFKYCDLDYYRHVNTVRYVDLILNQFPLRLYDEMSVQRLELSFLHEAKYGMKTILTVDEEIENREYTMMLSKAEDNSPLMFSKIFFSS